MNQQPSATVLASPAEQIALFALPALPHHCRPALTSLPGGRIDRVDEQLALFVASLVPDVARGPAPFNLLAGGRPTSRDRAVLSKNQSFCEDCGEVCNLKPVVGKLNAWSEIEVCDVQTHRLRTAYFCELCTQKMWEIAA
jgi:hypothetical protein